VKAIAHRLTRLEDPFVPREDEQSLLLRERLRRDHERLASMGAPTPAAAGLRRAGLELRRTQSTG
jgi:hypothetical protein